jgi:hypothetical protein
MADQTPRGAAAGDAREVTQTDNRELTADERAAVDLYWLPLGAGGHSVRWNGRAFEAVAARLKHRSVRDLYHSALIVRLPGAGRYVIEQASVPDGRGKERGVVAEGPVGARGQVARGSSATRCADGVTAPSPMLPRPSKARSG